MATENRDLRSGVSVWDPAAFPSQKLTNDIKADALVIGAGVTGALMAESLSKHFSVAVVDRRGAASGSTVASTGLLLFEIDTPLIRLRKKIGRERADRTWRRSDSAMRALMSRVDALAIDCDLARRSSVYLPGTTLDADGLREEAEARAQCGLPSKWIGSGELQDRFGVSREAAIVSDFTAIKMGLYSPAIVLDFVHPFFANRCFVSTGGKRRFNEAGHFPRLCAFDHTRDEAGRRSRRCHLIPRETLVGAG